ncbi:hypothetical protein ACLQ2Y_25975 [Micromonospora echinospora]|uniref:Uncharacterized protein n=1 Tax=Micromonospora echinospora TaxID=1877 RepID=A0ABR6MB32_MICEC|nr:hypothetical protein [Micromonospora echinospora]MBB5112586.1 hypothetical protein [Micromonospora echinospora]
MDLGDLAHEHPDRVFDRDPVQRSQAGVEDENGVQRALLSVVAGDPCERTTGIEPAA